MWHRCLHPIGPICRQRPGSRGRVDPLYDGSLLRGEMGQPAGQLVVGMTPDERLVVMQFTDPAWFIEFTPAEARNLAHLLWKKAAECKS